MANSKIPGPVGTYPIRIDSGTLSRTKMPKPGVIGIMNQASHAKVDHAKRALAIDIGQLILDITGIFDPSPISDGTNMLISLARGNWVDAVASAVSIAPYLGDLSKTAKLPRYIKSVREAIRIAKFDYKWANALRTLFTKLTKVLDECIKLAADVLPNSAKTQLKELKYEVDKFLDPVGGTTNKLADSGKKADLRPSSNSTKSQRNIDRAKPPEKLDKKPEKGYDSNKNNGPKTAIRRSETQGSFTNLGSNPSALNKASFDSYPPKSGFSGAYDPESGKFLAYPSGETKLIDGSVPENLVGQFGGHEAVNEALDGVLGKKTSNRLGFVMIKDEAGNFGVKWNSGMINGPNPNFPGRAVPESYRQEILDAISEATGRKAYSAK